MANESTQCESATNYSYPASAGLVQAADCAGTGSGSGHRAQIPGGSGFKITHPANRVGPDRVAKITHRPANRLVHRWPGQFVRAMAGTDRAGSGAGLVDPADLSGP